MKGCESVSEEPASPDLLNDEKKSAEEGSAALYAGFLKEAYEIMKIPQLDEAAEKFIATGDVMRKSAMAKVIRGKQDPGDLSEVFGNMREWLQMEREAYLILKSIKWK